jgi:hypothetical protein
MFHAADPGPALAFCRDSEVVAECAELGRRFPAVPGSIYGGKVQRGRKLRGGSDGTVEASDPRRLWRAVEAIAAEAR